MKKPFRFILIILLILSMTTGCLSKMLFDKSPVGIQNDNKANDKPKSSTNIFQNAASYFRKTPDIETLMERVDSAYYDIKNYEVGLNYEFSLMENGEYEMYLNLDTNLTMDKENSLSYSTGQIGTVPFYSDEIEKAEIELYGDQKYDYCIFDPSDSKYRRTMKLEKGFSLISDINVALKNISENKEFFEVENTSDGYLIKYTGPIENLLVFTIGELRQISINDIDSSMKILEKEMDYTLLVDKAKYNPLKFNIALDADLIDEKIGTGTITVNKELILKDYNKAVDIVIPQELLDLED